MNEHTGLIAEILKIPGASVAINVAMEAEIRHTVNDLRNAARDGNPIEAAQLEGKLQVLENVSSLLTRFAQQAPQSHKE